VTTVAARADGNAQGLTFFNNNKLTGKGKGKVHPRTGHEGPEGE